MLRTLLLLSPLLLSGCAALPLAALGTVAGITATAVSTGADVYSMGKLDSAELAQLHEVHDAIHHIAAEMGLSFVREDAEPGKFHFRYADSQEAITKITLDARTPELTRIRIDVGVFGSEPTARLMLKRIRVYLAEPLLPEPSLPEADHEFPLPPQPLDAQYQPQAAVEPAAL